MKPEHYIAANKKMWDHWASLHPTSAFYDRQAFMSHRMSLHSIERDLLPDLSGKRVLHIQCHFGQDTISLATLGANEVVGLDFSSEAIMQGERLVADCGIHNVSFVESDALQVVEDLAGTFDVVFASYGVIGWHESAKAWIDAAFSYLKPGGELVFAEFHPVLWILDEDFKDIVYPYFNTGVITETRRGSYASPEAAEMTNHTWNHSLSEVIKPIVDHNERSLVYFNEYDWSPYAIFDATSPAKGKYQIKGKEGLFPLVYSFKARKL